VDPLLTSEERQVVHEQRQLLDEARRLIEDLDMLPDDLEVLSTLRQQLEELFLVVVVGEYNAGKSTFLNALLGNNLLETGELPTTRQVHQLRFGEVENVVESAPGLLLHELPADLLRDLNIVDTPGTNSMQREEQALTEGFVPRADLVFFLTSLMQPYSASESEFLKLIRSWGKQIVFVINQVDLASSPDHVERVKRYVRQQASEQVEGERPLFAISAREIAEGRPPSDHNEWNAFQVWVQDTLRRRDRVQWKLRAPLDSLDAILTRQAEVLAERVRLIQGDRTALEKILREIDAYESRMHEDVARYHSKITNVLWQMEKRGNRFFDELVRLSNLLRLRNVDVVENRFRNEVIGDTPQRIEEEVQALIDWLVRQNLVIWEQADGQLQKRREALREAASRTRWISPEYVYNREEIFASLARPVRERLDRFDARDEADEIVASVNDALARTFGIQAVVVGLGAILTAATTTLTIDVTGALGATLLAVTGLFILPHRRGRLKRDLARKVEVLRKEVEETLESRFRGQVSEYAQTLREAFQPELETTLAQEKSMALANERLARLQERGAELKQRIPKG
jgi:small GTP-binding protein